jgi:DNA replication and repair protein RecF
VECEIKSFGYNYKIRLFLSVHLKNLRLINFKNYADQSVHFTHDFMAVVGPNGSGKTNLLEALNYLSLTRPLGSAGDARNIRLGENFFSIIGQFESGGQVTEVRCTAEVKEGQTKKEIRVGGKECRRLADHIGKFPVVSLVPQDIELIWEAGESRRKFFDQWMSQTDRSLMEDLIRYQQALKNRNVLLRNHRDGAKADMELLKFYTGEMKEPAVRIHRFRVDFIRKINPVLNGFYARLISPETAEQVAVRYDSELSEIQIDELFEAALDRDLRAGRTTRGPHLDEFMFLLNGEEVRKFGSQGQQKSFLVALKLTMHRLLSEMTGISPILLLDDVFDKMDDLRISNLLSVTTGEGFGQVILTESSPERAREKLKGFTFGAVGVEKGLIKKL